jgi:hypothetical protein
MASVFLAMFVPFLVALVRALTVVPQPSGNWYVGLLITCLVALLAIVSAWYWTLFAIHLRSARTVNGAVEVERFFAPGVKISRGLLVKRRAVPVPSFRVPYYQRGVLFMVGMSSFYVPDSFLEARELIDSVLTE